MTISLNSPQTIGAAILIYFFGKLIVNRTSIFNRFSIPATVVGGVLFSMVNLIGYMTGFFIVEFDTSLQNFFMTVFFTSVGFVVNTKILSNYGLRALRFTLVLLILIVSQNIVGVFIANQFDIHPLYGLLTGSASMVGGHGTTAAVATDYESLYGAANATTVGLAAATFGLISGGLIGGPVGNFIMKRYKINPKLDNSNKEEKQLEEIKERKNDNSLNSTNLSTAAFQIFIAMGLGSLVQIALESIGISFPAYVGAMLVAVFMRLLSDKSENFQVHLEEANALGNIALTVFVSMALISIKLWELIALALPMIVILLTQVLFISIFMIFIGFPILGKDYDAAVMVTGICGFGLGAMPNGVSNMQAFTEKWGPSPTAFLIVPGVGSVFIDFFNIGILTLFVNILM